MKKVIIARFIGADKSLGFINDKIYILEMNIVKPNNLIRVETYNAKRLVCEYSTAITFLNNWDEIVNVNE